MNIQGGFVSLFRGRADCYGSWEGGCVKRPLTLTQFDNHLEGREHIGVYPLVPVWGELRCVWGCSDIDYPDPEDAISLVVALSTVGLNPWLERTRKGWHVWIFAKTLVPAADMRNAFLAAHQVIQVPPKEVNPKQVSLANGQVGNYVRLPYPGGLEERRMYQLTDTREISEVPLSLEDFVSAALLHRNSEAQIAEVASYYTPPPPPPMQLAPAVGDVAVAAARLNGLGKTIYREGPIEGRDRSTTLAHLAHECAKSGLAPGDALLVLEDADWRWGKYLQRGARGEVELVKLVERAYGPSPSS